VGRKGRPRTPEEVAAARAALPIEWILEEGRQARMQELASLDLTAREPIRSGLPREEALRIYTASVNQPDTLFSFNESLPAKLDRMRALLHDPISVDEANALNDVLGEGAMWTWSRGCRTTPSQGRLLHSREIPVRRGRPPTGGIPQAARRRLGQGHQGFLQRQQGCLP
jgi:hypothetical protein